ncbi:ubiquitin-related domain-containing protein [Bisporella sp. PMI_857]|nr:ubiquitin-related domain-containing protein [Bisporella sp. PMI_857]
MADRRSRSRSPTRAKDGPSRHRSRSPRRRDDRPRRGGGRGGFQWKEKRRTNDEPEGREKGLERGYRKRSRSPRRDRERNREGEKEKKSKKFGNPSTNKKKKDEDSTAKPPERAAPPTSTAYQEPMIIVHVNDRLGTKAQIPCLASDPIKLFKAQVAARIGRQPHEIMLKRQGERPFKDQLTLEDYGISNGVQIDLEIDTGE